MNGKLIFLVGLLLILCSCKGEEPPAEQQSSKPATGQGLTERGCRACHPDIAQDQLHSLPCQDCHGGNPEAATRTEAHRDLVVMPAHPEFMTGTCGRCHPKTVQESSTDLHFTLRNEVNLVRGHFGAPASIDDLHGVSPSARPETELELADDMLRRRCLRCHLFSTGDEYPYTHRGTGCAACHLKFVDGKPETHEMIGAPHDSQCLSCHYGNFVGADYYGRYDHDYNWEYRTPYTTSEPFIRPYGIEYHELAPDIHQQRGLACIDCHSGHPDKPGSRENIGCSSCHRPAGGNYERLPDNVSLTDGTPVLTARLTGRQHPIPQLQHPAHAQYALQIACQVCHAQWGFNDFTTHLLRSDVDDYFPWERLTVQSSSEIERLLEHNIYSDEEELPAAMRDGVTGESLPGIWYKGFTQRRWENIVIRRDRDGQIKVFRPILDLRLSFVDADENLLFESVTGQGPGLLPYTPHTTGPAGLFYRYRFADLLDQTAQPHPTP